MAVQGATPRRIMPAMYCVASPGSTRSANSTRKNSQPNAAMENGLMSQFTTTVSASPLGRRPTSRMAVKSICTIIG
jgi:hypothetical protein